MTKTWYSAVQTKVPCIELAVTAFLKPRRAFVKEENMNASYTNNLCQMLNY